jgi:hypothetical protein
MTETKVKATALGGVPDALRRLVQAELELGRTVLESLVGTPLPELGSVTRRASKCCTGSCDIPPPCWAPQSLGERTSHVSPCSDATLELALENCELKPRSIKVATTGYQGVVVTPADLTLGPLERARVRLVASIPKGTAIGTEHEVTIVIAGCKVHYLHWKLSVGTLGLTSDQPVKVKDCRDFVHHWYDHFYCPRPCAT